MERFRSFMPRIIQLFSLTFATMLLSTHQVYAEEMAGGKMLCPMCGAMGWGGMILGGLLMVSVIAALGALTIYLIRRSRSAHPGH